MATTVTINAQDVAAAANFLEQFLTDSVPAGDFGTGTALRDLTIGALAAVFAFLRADATQVRQLQSLVSVSEATGGDVAALRDAVVAILSNFFISPKSGGKARGIAIAHLSQQSDIFIALSHRFTRQAGLVYVVDSTDTYFIPQADLVPIVDSNNVVLEYQARIPLVAVATGTAYNVDPGLFSDFDRFNPFVTRIENPEKFDGGSGAETVDQILARAPTAISVRNLINARSIEAVLTDTFDQIRAILVVGMGEPEMQRDRLTAVAQSLALHLGGAADIYLDLDLVETIATGTVGGVFARPDGIANVLRDPVLGTFGGVQVGDVVRITAGLPTVPLELQVIANRGTELLINEKVPFPLASDELVPPASVSYTVGRVPPVFNDVIAGVGGVPLPNGVTSRHMSNSGRAALPGGPVMEILDVAITDPPLGEAAFKDPTDGFVHFPNQTNATPLESQTPDEGLQYQTIINNPLSAQSMRQYMELQVGTDTNLARFDGLTLRTRYKTLSGFGSIDTFVRDRRQRTVAADQLCRARFPVTVLIPINYKLRSDATATLDSAVVAQSVVSFINAFDTSIAPIDVSAINQFIRDTYPTIASVLPFTITYKLLTPTGVVITYETVDEVRIDDAKRVAGPYMDLLSLGVSSRTVRYLSSTLDVTVTQVP